MDLKVNVNSTDHVQGPANAPIELVEYADYQCPYCKKAYYIIKELQKELGDSLKLVFRNFPLTEMHPNALNAALAAETAAAQDKFWDMHDILFENQEFLDDSYLLQYAKIIKLDMPRFEEDVQSEKYYDKVQADYSSGLKSHVQGTPALFINGKQFNGDYTSPKFLDYLKTYI